MQAVLEGRHWDCGMLHVTAPDCLPTASAFSDFSGNRCHVGQSLLNSAKMKSHSLTSNTKSPGSACWASQKIQKKTFRQASISICWTVFGQSSSLRISCRRSGWKMLGNSPKAGLAMETFFHAPGSKYIIIKCKPTFGLLGQSVNRL